MNIFFLFFSVKWFLFQERRAVKKRYTFFQKYYDAFQKEYRFCNPYSMSRRYLQTRGEKDIHQYGETPLSTFDKIASECQLNSRDCLIELGCGTGYGAFFLRKALDCRVIGVDWLPEFIEKAQSIAQAINDPLISFKCENMLDTDLSEATAIYLYGTCLPDSLICELIKRIPHSVKIITVSFPLSDYSSDFSIEKQFTARFPWGDAEVYLNKK